MRSLKYLQRDMFNMKICRNCNVLNDDHALKCWNCGADLQSAPPYIPVVVYPNRQRRDERNTVILFTAAALIAMMFLLPAILGGFIVNGEAYRYDIEPNNTFSFARNVSLSDNSLNGFLNERTDQKDFYRFSFSRPVVSINFTLVFEDRNRFNITVYDKDMQPLSLQRNSTTTGKMHVERAYIERYGDQSDIYVRIAAVSGYGEYFLHFEIYPKQTQDYPIWDNTGDGTGEKGMSFATAIPIDSDGNYMAQMDAVNSPIQIYSMSIREGKLLQCSLSTDIRLNAGLYDSHRNPLSSLSLQNNRSQIRFNTQKTDAYYLVLRALSGTGIADIGINITNNPFYDGNNDMEDAESLVEAIGGELNRSCDPVDYLKVFLSDGAKEKVSINCTSPLGLSLLRDDGEEVMQGIVDEQAEFYINATETGYYYIQLVPEGAEGNYTISTTEVISGEPNYIYITDGNTGSETYTGENVRLIAITPAGTSDTITWDFGDSTIPQTGETVLHSFSKAGNYTITATRSDNGETDRYVIHVQEPKKEAIIIGISDYIESSVGDLNYCHLDALHWRNYLQPRGYKISLLINGSAKKERIISEIQRVERNTNERDRVLFIFSGHGFRINGREFIAPADTKSFSTSNDISDLLLHSLFLTMRSQHRLFFIDSCYSGGMNEVADNNTLFISATTDSELSVDSSTFKDGLWTYYFLEVGLIKDNNSAFEDAFYAVNTEYTDYAHRNYDISCHAEIIDNNPSVPFSA